MDHQYQCCKSSTPSKLFYCIHETYENINNMRFTIPGVAVCALFVASASAAGNGIFAANGVELETYKFGEDVIYGEPVNHSLINV